jgi:tRNA modification GTPase
MGRAAPADKRYPAHMHTGDTIAAIATAPGEGGVSIVRISGPASHAIADAVFTGPPPVPSRRAAGTFVVGRLQEADGSTIDEALLLLFRAPRSFTREDVVEIQGHGGPVVARRILKRVLDAGARMAEPGEFTRRAFLNGRLDLAQAEAVQDLIRARSDRAAAAAVEQLTGDLTRRVDRIYEGLLRAAANLEATLDFPDDELPSSILDGLTQDLSATRTLMAELLATWNEGHLLREGATIVIAGKPNVGKSTLLNALLGKDRAIVSDQPGTTRDTIEESLVLGGYHVKLVDTAGLRHAECSLEQAGIRRSEQQLSRADLLLYVIDCSQPVDKEDENIIKTFGSRVILVRNKDDSGCRRMVATDYQHDVNVSALHGLGLHELRQLIIRVMEGAPGHSVQHAAISERHRQLLSQAAVRTDDALKLLGESGNRSDLAADQLRDAMELTGLITGRTYHNDLLDSIFSRFCIGK